MKMARHNTHPRHSCEGTSPRTPIRGRNPSPAAAVGQVRTGAATAIFISLYGLHKAMVIPAKAGIQKDWLSGGALADAQVRFPSPICLSASLRDIVDRSVTTTECTLMTEVGISELKTRMSHIIRRVRYANETFLITYRDRPVAKLTPIQDTGTGVARDLSILEEMDRLAEEITKHWPKGVSAVDAVSQDRREL